MVGVRRDHLMAFHHLRVRLAGGDHARYEQLSVTADEVLFIPCADITNTLDPIVDLNINKIFRFDGIQVYPFW